MSIPAWLLRSHKLSRLPRLSQLPLGVEITLLLLLKITLLFILAKAFFSEPQAKHMHMPTALVEQHLLGSAPTYAATSQPASSVSDFSPTITEVTHAAH